MEEKMKAVMGTKIYKLGRANGYAVGVHGVLYGAVFGLDAQVRAVGAEGHRYSGRFPHLEILSFGETFESHRVQSVIWIGGVSIEFAGQS